MAAIAGVDRIYRRRMADDPSLRARLRSALTDAMKARDTVATAALRSALGAIDNAEAVAVEGPADYGDGGMGEIGLGEVGLGVAEVPRRMLSDGDVAAILRAEIAERAAEAVEYDGCGQPERAAQLRAEANVIAALLTD